MRTERPYSRVYWEARTDPKFASVWHDDTALATWLRLLVNADMAWPAAAEYYAGVKRAAVKRLADAGLVDPVDDHMYRIHGLDRERGVRQRFARYAVGQRRDRQNGGGTDEGTDVDTEGAREYEASNDADTDGVPPVYGRGTKPSQAKTRQGKRGTASAVPPARTRANGADQDVHLEAWYRLTARPPKPTVITWLNDMAAEHGEEAVADGLVAEHGVSTDPRTLLSRTQNRLLLASREQQRQRQAAEVERQEQERRLMQAMPPEQRRANLRRLRDMMKTAGLVPDQPASEGGK